MVLLLGLLCSEKTASDFGQWVAASQTSETYLLSGHAKCVITPPRTPPAAYYLLSYVICNAADISIHVGFLRARPANRCWLGPARRQSLVMVLDRSVSNAKFPSHEPTRERTIEQSIPHESWDQDAHCWIQHDPIQHNSAFCFVGSCMTFHTQGRGWGTERARI